MYIHLVNLDLILNFLPIWYNISICSHWVTDYLYICISAKYILVFLFSVTMLYVVWRHHFFCLLIFPLFDMCSLKIFTFGRIVGLLILLPINCAGVSFVIILNFKTSLWIPSVFQMLTMVQTGEYYWSG